MARRITIGFWLLTTGCLLIGAGCTAKSGDLPKGEGSSKHQSLPEKAMSPWQRDIQQYRLHTKDSESIRSQAEEFLRIVQLGMLPHPRGPGTAKTAAMGKKLFEQGCQDPLVKCYYGRAVYSDQGYFDAMHPLVDALNAFQKSDYPPEYQRVGLLTFYSEL